MGPNGAWRLVASWIYVCQACKIYVGRNGNGILWEGSLILLWIFPALLTNKLGDLQISTFQKTQPPGLQIKMGNKDFTCYYVDGLSAQNIVLGKRNFCQENCGLTNCMANMLTVVLGVHQLSAISGLRKVQKTLSYCFVATLFLYRQV